MATTRCCTPVGAMLRPLRRFGCPLPQAPAHRSIHLAEIALWLRAGPEVRRRGRTGKDLLGNGGVGLAGDAFDARIVRKLVSPALGSDSEARSLNKLLPAVPAWIYANLERWHYLSFLRNNNVREILKSARIRALEPEKIEALIGIIDEDLG